MLAELSVQDLLAETAAAKPVPGGGSMAALAGAVAASLTEMVANLTAGKKGYEAVAEEMKAIAAGAAEAREKMIAAIDRDAEAYRQVVVASGMPKDSEDRKTRRSQAIQEALKSASLAPLEAARESMAIMELAGRVLARGNSNAFSDAAVAVMCARTAALGAISNVRVNLADIKDSTFAKNVAGAIDGMEEKVRRREQELLA